MKKIEQDSSRTLYVGGIYEVDKNAGGSVTGTKTYYPAAGAMKDGSTLYYVLKDHASTWLSTSLGSASGVSVGENRYYPFGETRITTGTMFTDKLFTGQRQVAELGIYHYGARFYSPKLGRFLSADTIVPGYANPQNLNRFSYVTNNPLRYTDPTGHMMWEGDGGNLTPLQTAIDAQKRKKHEQEAARRKCERGNRAYCSGWDNAKKSFQNAVDAFLWRAIPSAIGIDYGVQAQYGLFAEAEVTPYEKQIIYNWRSKQLSVFEGSGTGGYLGSPTMLGLTGYVGVMTVYGASDNSYVAGHSKQLGATAQADIVGTAGINKAIGASWDNKNGSPFVDPVSGIPVSFRQTNIIGGVNIIPDGFDVGIFAGQSDSEMLSEP